MENLVIAEAELITAGEAVDVARKALRKNDTEASRAALESASAAFHAASNKANRARLALSTDAPFAAV